MKEYGQLSASTSLRQLDGFVMHTVDHGVSQKHLAMSPRRHEQMSGLKAPAKIGRAKCLSPCYDAQSRGRPFPSVAILDQRLASQQQTHRSPSNRMMSAGGFYHGGSEVAGAMVARPCVHCNHPQPPQMLVGNDGGWAASRAQKHTQIQPKVLGMPQVQQYAYADEQQSIRMSKSQKQYIITKLPPKVVNVPAESQMPAKMLKSKPTSPRHAYPSSTNQTVNTLPSRDSKASIYHL